MIELTYAENFYGGRKDELSGVPLINHVHDGLAVLREIGASDFAKRAFCLLPLFQSDDDLRKHYLRSLPGVPAQVLVLVMEYRNQANAWLSDKVIRDVEWVSAGASETITYRTTGEPTSGPLPEVRDMLVAAKVRRYKDLRAVSLATDPLHMEMQVYFKTWFKALGIDDIEVARLADVVDVDSRERAELGPRERHHGNA